MREKQGGNEGKSDLESEPVVLVSGAEFGSNDCIVRIVPPLLHAALRHHSEDLTLLKVQHSTLRPSEVQS